MKRKTLLATLLTAVVAVLLTSCGTGDKVSSVTLSAVGNGTGTVEVKGEGGTLQLAATANYTSGKMVDVTNLVTYVATPMGTDVNGNALPSPPQDLAVNTTGMVTAMPPFVCTFFDTTATQGTTATPVWALNGSYQVIATYKGMASQPLFVAVASATGNAPDGSCGP